MPNTFLSPFAINSVWNLPLQAGVIHTPLGLLGSDMSARLWGLELIGIRQTNAGDPLKTKDAKTSDTYCIANLGASEPAYSVNIPDSFLFTKRESNGIMCFVQPDGSILESYLFQRCVAGDDPADRFRPCGVQGGFPYEITGDGVPNHSGSPTVDTGPHKGTNICGLGGPIRLGEWISAPGVPIGHTLALSFNAGCHTYHPEIPNEGGAEQGPGWWWPAGEDDGYAGNPTTGYNGNFTTAPDHRIGRLVSVDPNETEASLGLITEQGKKFFNALRVYGAITNDSTSLADASFRVSAMDSPK